MGMTKEVIEKLRKRVFRGMFLRKGFVYYIDMYNTFCRVNVKTQQMEFVANRTWGVHFKNIGEYVRKFVGRPEALVYNKFFNKDVLKTNPEFKFKPKEALKKKDSDSGVSVYKREMTKLEARVIMYEKEYKIKEKELDITIREIELTRAKIVLLKLQN